MVDESGTTGAANGTGAEAAGWGCPACGARFATAADRVLHRIEIAGAAHCLITTDLRRQAWGQDGAGCWRHPAPSARRAAAAEVAAEVDAARREARARRRRDGEAFWETVDWLLAGAGFAHRSGTRAYDRVHRFAGGAGDGGSAGAAHPGLTVTETLTVHQSGNRCKASVALSAVADVAPLGPGPFSSCCSPHRPVGVPASGTPGRFAAALLAIAAAESAPALAHFAWADAFHRALRDAAPAAWRVDPGPYGEHFQTWEQCRFAAVGHPEDSVITTSRVRLSSWSPPELDVHLLWCLPMPGGARGVACDAVYPLAGVAPDARPEERARAAWAAVEAGVAAGAARRTARHPFRALAAALPWPRPSGVPG